MTAAEPEGFFVKIGVQLMPVFRRALRTAFSIQVREGTQLTWSRRPFRVRVQPGWSI
jgi:hypothetical protein